MNPIVKNILAVLAGVVLGSIVNMGIILIGPSIIPPPEGADVTTMEGLKATMHLFEPKHFIMPFLAHALGTFSGAFVTALIAASRKMAFALVIGLFFLAGGIYNLFVLPSPTWFAIADVALAYGPMAWFGGWLAWRTAKKSEQV
jgi:hypothetical protein